MGKRVKRVEEDVRPVRKYNKRECNRKSFSEIEWKAYRAWNGQDNRCNNPKSKAYQYYGAKGVELRYGRTEFIEWYKKEMETFDGTKPNVGRMDHNGHYEFGNIQIESKSSNTREMAARTFAHGHSSEKKVGLFSKNTHECIATFKSIAECADYFGMNRSAIGKSCAHPRPKGSNKYSWYYRFV